MSNLEVIAVDPSAAEQPTYVPDLTPAVAPSPLDALRAKLASATLDLHKDLPVPRWREQFGLSIFVSYKPLSPAYASKVTAEFEKTKDKDPDWEVKANAQMLFASCRGVYAIDPANPETKQSLKLGNPSGPQTKFDVDLEAFLGNLVTVHDSLGIVRALYLTEGDLMVAAQQLLNWSATAEEGTDPTTP